MSGTEALARVLWDSPAWSKPWAELRMGQQEKMRATLEQAERILADPGPLLAALHQAGVLHRQTRRLERGGPREGRYATVEPDGRIGAGDGLATDWEATDS